jgi:hypothetical protein
MDDGNKPPVGATEVFLFATNDFCLLKTLGMTQSMISSGLSHSDHNLVLDMQNSSTLTQLPKATISFIPNVMYGCHSFMYMSFHG